MVKHMGRETIQVHYYKNLAELVNVWNRLVLCESHFNISEIDIPFLKFSIET